MAADGTRRALLRASSLRRKALRGPERILSHILAGGSSAHRPALRALHGVVAARKQPHGAQGARRPAAPAGATDRARQTRGRARRVCHGALRAQSMPATTESSPHRGVAGLSAGAYRGTLHALGAAVEADVAARVARRAVRRSGRGRATPGRTRDAHLQASSLRCKALPRTTIYRGISVKSSAVLQRSQTSRATGQPRRCHDALGTGRAGRRWR